MRRSSTLLRTGPGYCGIEILSVRMRPSDPTILDIVYKVSSAKETVKVRALAYEDGKRSFATAVPVLAFADGTGGERRGCRQFMFYPSAQESERESAILEKMV